MEMQISNATEFPLYHHSMATGPHSFQLPGAIPPVSTIPTYKNTMFPERLSGFYYDSAGVTHHHAMPAERCDRCYAELSVTGGGHHFGKRLCGMCAAKEQQQVSPKVETEILDLDSQQVMSQQQQRQQQQQDTSKAFLQQHGGVVVPPGYDRPPQPPPPPPPAVEWPGYFQPQQNTLSGEHLSPDYNNVSTTTTTPPTMMGGSPPSDMQQQQQQYQANFDGGGGGYAIDSNQPPGGGGSGSGGGSSGTKGNGSWKSNEARRAKTYECPACDKWFTSSGHLKRHYGTQLHKNAVKQSGKPDPALLPMKHHYHPYRDPAYVAQQKLKQQQQNGSSLHKQQQQQSSMMMPADFRPVTSSTSSSFNTDSFLELTPPNLTASLSDSLGGTQYLPARRPVSNSSSSSNSNSSSNSTAGFTEEMQISSYPCNSNKYQADPTVSRTAAHHPATSYPGHRQPTAGQQALSAYLHHQNTDTIQPYTTQVSMIQTPTNTDLYTTMPDNSGHHLYQHHQHHHLQQPPPPYHLQHAIARDQQLHHQLPPPPPSQSHHHRQPVNRQQTIDYQQPSSTTLPPSPYQQQQQHQHQLHHHQHQQQHSIIKQEPVEYNVDDAPVASPDSSIDHHNHHQNHLQQQQQQQQHHHHQHHQYRGLLVVAPASPASPPPAVPLLTTLHPAAAAADDETAVSDCSGGSVDLDAGGSPQSLCGHVLSPSSSSSSLSSKKLRKATRVKCDICNKDFTDKCYKTQHDQRFHSGEKPYRCGVCGKRFGEHKLLQVHELRHNDSNKAFPCTVCTKSFNFKNDLDRHFMSSHSADKPYQCVQCDKKFVRLDHKRHHEKTHDDAVDKMTKKKKKTTSSPTSVDGRCYGGQLHMHLAEDQS